MSIRIKGDEANVYAVYSEEPQVLTITLNLRPMSRRVGGIEDAWLDGTVASWTPAIGAESYDIYLYRDERPIPPLISAPPCVRTESIITRCAPQAERG